MNVISLIGRIILGGYFIMAGVNHFLAFESSVGYATSKGVPFANLAVIGTGLLMLVGGALVLIGYKVRWGAWLLILFLVPTSFIMHAFWAVDDPQMAQADMVNFTKNFGLIGALLMIASIPWWPMGVEKRTPTTGD
ncbi:MAG: DoxX family protein [Thermoanaerobaculia bacterium]